MMCRKRPGSFTFAGLVLLASLSLLPAACVIDLDDLSGGKGGAGTTGTTSATGTTTPTGTGGAAPVTAAQLQALVASCNRFPGSTDFAAAPGGPSNVPICTLKDAVWWTSGMLIACDGGKGAVCKASAGYSALTAGTDSMGQPLDASTLPFVVVPQPSNGFDFSTAGIGYGSVVAVLYKAQLVYAIVGDLGDKGIAGEGSYALAGELSIPQNPSTGGTGSGVTYILFTGPLAMVAKNEDPNAPRTMGPGLAAKLVADN